MERNRTLITVKIGNVVVPDIVLDTGFAFDGLMIYNPDYRDSLDLEGAMEVRVPGAGSGEASRALMADPASFSIGEVNMINHRLIVLLSDTYKGFPSNGIIGYSIFGHYAFEFNYDTNTMTLHNSAELNVDESWTELPIYFKGNNVPWVDVSVVIRDEEPILLSSYIDYAAGDAILLLEKPGMKFRFPEKRRMSI